MKWCLVSALVLLLIGCSSEDPKVARQQNLLDQIQTRVTLNFEDSGPAKVPMEGKWEHFRFTIFNEYRESVWILRIKPVIISAATKEGNPEAYCYRFELKNKLGWYENGGMMGQPSEYMEIPSGKSIEFTGLFHSDAPDVKGDEIRGSVTIYCDTEDPNGRHIISSPLVVPP
jgi:hypothetical protein